MGFKLTPKNNSIAFIRNDIRGEQELKNFVMSGKNKGIITLSNGKKYTISLDKSSLYDENKYNIELIES